MGEALAARGAAVKLRPDDNARGKLAAMDEDEESRMIARREAEVQARPPRIPVPDTVGLDTSARSVIVEVLGAMGRPVPEKLPDHTAIMLLHPELYRRHTELGLQLYRGALPVRLRELAVLRVGWRCRAPFEWGEHVDAGKRLAGLSSEEIAAVKQGWQAACWHDADRAVLRAVDELMDEAMISDACFAELESHLDAAQLIELPILVGQYIGVAYLQNALRFPLLKTNPGLRAG